MSSSEKKPVGGFEAPSPGSPVSLPAHSVRVSSRARRIGLRVLPGKGLEVVLPRQADPACVPAVLHRHRHWIEKHLKRVQEWALCQDGGRDLPESLLLKGGLEEVRIFPRYFPSGTSTPETPAGGAPGTPPPPASGTSPGSAPGTPADNTAGRSPEPAPGPVPGQGAAGAARTARPPSPLSSRDLVLTGDSPAVVLHRLREWIREEARVRLGGMLGDLAAEHGFCYTSFTVRFQRSRWGSCSARGGINLNACLIFLPDRLMRYIVLHELCHTRQMNHSQAFWKELFSVDPEALAHDKAMRGAWRHVPAWIFA